ncbi:MAG: hypothetical protein ACOCW6_04670 [Spirochaetota bacterium]
MDNRNPPSYQLVAALLPENLTAIVMETQGVLFREGGLPFAQALPPFVPLRWCTDTPERLPKLLTHSERPETGALPLSIGGWIGVESEGAAPFVVAAALEVHPSDGIEKLVDFFARRSPQGPHLFDGYLGSLVLAVAPQGTHREGALPSPRRLTAKVLRLGLLRITLKEEMVYWEEYELGWLSGSRNR